MLENFILKKFFVVQYLVYDCEKDCKLNSNYFVKKVFT